MLTVVCSADHLLADAQSQGVTELFQIPRFPPLPFQFGQDEVLADNAQPDAEVSLRLIVIQLFVSPNECQLNDFLGGVDIGQPMRSVSQKCSLVLPDHRFVRVEVSTEYVFNRCLLHSAIFRRSSRFRK